MSWPLELLGDNYMLLAACPACSQFMNRDLMHGYPCLLSILGQHRHAMLSGDNSITSPSLALYSFHQGLCRQGSNLLVDLFGGTSGTNLGVYPSLSTFRAGAFPFATFSPAASLISSGSIISATTTCVLCQIPQCCFSVLGTARVATKHRV